MYQRDFQVSTQHLAKTALPLASNYTKHHLLYATNWLVALMLIYGHVMLFFVLITSN